MSQLQQQKHESVTITATESTTGSQIQISYGDIKPVGNGSFGYVYEAFVRDLVPVRKSESDTDNGIGASAASLEEARAAISESIMIGERVAIKKVLQDKRFKNRELQIMRMLKHPNIVQLKAYFLSNSEKPGTDEVYLNLIIEFIPETIYKASRSYTKQKQFMPFLLIKLYMYQLFRALAYVHALGICHRDIKPQNLLLDPQTGVLKLCDFGSAKVLVPGEPNVSYICSRYYRAPELIFGSTQYTTHIDLWSSGCVMGELILGQPMFPGDSGVDQLVEIIKILGTPTREQVRAMNQNYNENRFPVINSHPWSKVFRNRPHTPPEGLDLISSLLEYTPTKRINALEALTHQFFDELRNPDAKLHGGADLPPLFNFSPRELSAIPDLNRKLVPPHAEADLADRGVDLNKYIYASSQPL